jgi:hypothetical protein
MQITTGYDYFDLSKNNRKTPVVIDTKSLLNPHALILGTTGTGKSFTIRNYLRQALASGAKVHWHVIDVHGDLSVPGASVVEFSEQAPYGLNPLVINPDQKFGGVHRCIRAFIRVINQASTTKLGVQQEDCIRNMLLDVFEEFGFDPEDPSTWSVNAYESRLVAGGATNRIYLEVPIADKDTVKSFGGRWDPERKLWWTHTENYKGELTKWKPAFKPRAYPTLHDVVNYAKELHEQRFLGSDQRAVRALNEHHKAAQAYHRAQLNNLKEKRLGFNTSESDEKLEEAKENALDSYKTYLNSVRTGRELELLRKYQDPTLVKSSAIRLTNFLNTGIFKTKLPPFDPDNKIWRYKLDALEMEEKKMFVLFKLQELFSKAVQRGQQDDVVEIVILDELGMYTSSADGEKGEGIIGTIARESRKYGLGLWGATQTPTSVPESLFTAVATTIVLGIHEKFHKAAVPTMGIDDKLLKWIQPQVTIAVSVHEKGQAKARWRWVQLDRIVEPTKT